MTATVQCGVLCNQPTGSLLGAEFNDDNSTSTITVAGDGVSVYQLDTQSLLSSHALGGAGRYQLGCAAVHDASTNTLVAVVSEVSDNNKQKIVRWPSGIANKRNAVVKSTSSHAIADTSESVPLPGPTSALHVLYPAAPDAGSVTVAVLAEGKVGYCSGQSVQLKFVSYSSTSTNPRASCSSRSSLFVATQDESSAEAQIHLFAATYNSAQGSSLTHARTFSVASPGNSGVVHAIHAAKDFILVSWSSGAYSLVKGWHLERNQVSITHASLPASLQPKGSDKAASDAPQSKAQGKRKAAADAGDLKSGVSTAGAVLDDTQVIVATVRTAGTSSAPPELHFALIDQQFGCTVATGTATLEGVSVPVSTSSSSPTLRLHSRPNAAGKVLLQYGSSVAILTVDSKPATLLSLVGKLSVTNSNSVSKTNNVALNVPSLLSMLGSQKPTGQEETGVFNLLEIRNAKDVQQGLNVHNIPQLISRLSQANATEQKVDAGVLKSATTAAISITTPKQKGAAPAEAGQNVHASAATVTMVLTQLIPQLLLASARADNWDRIDKVLQLVPQQSLNGCCSVLVSAARSAQYNLLPLLSIKLDDVQPSTMAGLIKALTAASTNEKVKAAKKQYHQGLRQQAEAAVEASEQRIASCQPQPDVQASPQDADTLVEARREALAVAQCAAAAVDGFSLTQVLLHAPLSIHMDPTAMASALRSLSSSVVDKLLSYLALWVDKYMHQMGGAASTGAGVQLPYQLLFPTYPQILEITRLLLDMHLPRLLMAKDQPKCVATLMNLTGEQVRAYQQLLPLAGAVEHVRSGAPLPAAHVAAASPYTVQYIDLGIRTA